MKIKLIKLQDKFILVSDEEGKEGKNFNFALNKIDNLSRDYEEHSSEWNFCKKIIAGIPELPSIDFSLLSEEDCLKIGWVDIEKLKQKVLNKYIGKLSKSCHSPEDIDKITEKNWFGLWEGFQIAQSLNDKNCTCQQKIFNVEIQSEENVIKVVKILGS